MQMPVFSLNSLVGRVRVSAVQMAQGGPRLARDSRIPSSPTQCGVWVPGQRRTGGFGGVMGVLFLPVPFTWVG
jgi:hypothetical protein